MDDRYTRNDSGLCINTDNARYQHILERRQIDSRIKKVEDQVGGIANSINQLIDMIQRADENKLKRSED